jgi:hypothetical protein
MQMLAQAIRRETNKTGCQLGWRVGKKVVEQLRKQLRNNKIMTRESKFACATSEKCGTRPRAWNDQGLPS